MGFFPPFLLNLCTTFTVQQVSCVPRLIGTGQLHSLDGFSGRWQVYVELGRLKHPKVQSGKLDARGVKFKKYLINPKGKLLLNVVH